MESMIRMIMWIRSICILYVFINLQNSFNAYTIYIHVGGLVFIRQVWVSFGHFYFPVMQLQRPSKSDERQIWLAIKHHLANLLRSCCFMLTLQLTFIVLFLNQNCTHVNFIHIKHGQAKKKLHYFTIS